MEIFPRSCTSSKLNPWDQLGKSCVCEIPEYTMNVPTIETGLAFAAVEFRGKYTWESGQIRVWAGPTVPTVGPETPPKGIGRPPGEAGIGSVSLWEKGHWLKRPRKISLLLLFFCLFHFVQLLMLLLLIFFIFIFIFYIFIIFNIYFLFFYFYFIFSCFVFFLVFVLCFLFYFFFF